MEQGVNSPEKPVGGPVGEPATDEVAGDKTPGDDVATAGPAEGTGGGSGTAPEAAVANAAAQDTEAAEETVVAAPRAETGALPEPGDSEEASEPSVASASAPAEETAAEVRREDSAGEPSAADAVGLPTGIGAVADRDDVGQDRESGPADAAADHGEAAPAVVAAAVETAAAPAERSGAAGGRPRKRVLTGEVVSDKAEQSIVVSIAHRKKHRLYKKYRTLTKKLMAHDPDNGCRVGDVVRVIETRPLSRMKRWRVVEIVKRAT